MQVLKKDYARLRNYFNDEVEAARELNMPIEDWLLEDELDIYNMWRANNTGDVRSYLGSNVPDHLRPKYSNVTRSESTSWTAAQKSAEPRLLWSLIQQVANDVAT